MIRFVLPWPPSMNTYWRSVNRGPLAGRVLLSADGREYRKTVAVELHRQKIERSGIVDRLEVAVLAYVPDRRARDLDNLLKPMLDALQHAGVFENDSQIDRLSIERCSLVVGGRIEIEIRERGIVAEQEELGHGGGIMNEAHFEIYRSAGEWRWRLRAVNGKIIADSAEGYVDAVDCEKGITLVKSLAPNAPIQRREAAKG